MQSQYKSRGRLLRLGINLLWFAIIVFLTHITPVHPDDLVLARVFGTQQPIQNAHDFFSSIWIHQMTWGGEPVAWAIQQVFAIAPRLVYEICNGLVFVGAANLILQYASAALAFDKRGRESLIALCLIYLAMWFFYPSLYDLLWLNSGIGYFWFNTSALLFGFYFYKRALSQTNTASLKKSGAAPCILFFLLGFAVGASVSPPTGCALLAGFGLYILWRFYRKQPFDTLLFLAAVGLFIGFCISVFSPGNASRTALVAERTPYTASILFRLARTFFHGCRHCLVPLAITFFFVVLNRARHTWLEMDELFFVFLAFVNVAVMAIPNGYSPRTVPFSTMLMIIAGARTAVRYVTTSLACQQARPQLRKALWVMILFLTLYALLQIFTGVQMHYRQGTTFERETLYFLVNYDIFH